MTMTMTEREQDNEQFQSYDWANRTMAVEGTVSPTTHQSRMARVYDKYFSTGFYHLRYPDANKHTLHFILSELQKLELGPKHILDFGCGNGRYLLPILKNTKNRFTAYDICETPLKLLSERLDIEDSRERVSIIHGGLEQLARHMGVKGKADLILLMFGVLSHVGDRDTRLQLLRRLRTFLDNDSSRIILSVPNRLRRFTRMNGCVSPAGKESGDITYRRSYKGTELTFFYHLYTPKTLAAELREAGLVVHRMCAESFFPECWVTGSPVVGVLDQAICRILPPKRGYGILAVVGPDKTSGE